jgi:hypothetical protein
MKLSGHNFDNDVFDSLLDAKAKDIELKKTADTKEQPSVDGFFSSTTADNFENVQRENLDFIASELAFAADRAKVAVNAEDLVRFASQVQHENLRGKKLERAAQKYCSQLDREIAHPQGTTKISAGDLINQLASHKVVPAGYDPQHGANDSFTGKYIGSSKNPNSIWDTDALQKQAQTALGDEKIKESKKAQEEYDDNMKTAQWQDLQDKHSDDLQLHKGITNAGTGTVHEATNQNLPANTMSIFSKDRDFENIPSHTAGEDIIAIAEARANKKAESNAEVHDAQKPMNTKDSLNKLFNS